MVATFLDWLSRRRRVAAPGGTTLWISPWIRDEGGDIRRQYVITRTR